MDNTENDYRILKKFTQSLNYDQLTILERLLDPNLSADRRQMAADMVKSQIDKLKLF